MRKRALFHYFRSGCAVNQRHTLSEQSCFALSERHRVIGLSDFCRVFILSFSSFKITDDLRLRSADASGTRQISLGKINRFHCHPVTNTRAEPMDIGLRCCAPTYPQPTLQGASLPLGTPMHLLLLLNLRSSVGPCHIGVGFPPSGFQDRIYTSILLIMLSTRAGFAFSAKPVTAPDFRSKPLLGFIFLNRANLASA